MLKVRLHGNEAYHVPHHDPTRYAFVGFHWYILTRDENVAKVRPNTSFQCDTAYVGHMRAGRNVSSAQTSVHVARSAPGMNSTVVPVRTALLHPQALSRQKMR